MFHTAPWLLKKWWLLINDFDSYAFTPALPHQHSVELTALYTLQHRLPRNHSGGAVSFGRPSRRIYVGIVLLPGEIVPKFGHRME